MKELILKHLQKYGSITDGLAYNLYRCRRLAHYIYLLRKEGYEIESEDVPFVHSVTGRKSRYARYILTDREVA